MSQRPFVTFQAQIVVAPLHDVERSTGIELDTVYVRELVALLMPVPPPGTAVYVCDDNAAGKRGGCKCDDTDSQHW